MPAPANELFQQTAAPPQQQAGPFDSFLRPVEPRPIDQPMGRPSGFETGPAAAGTVALDFLRGVRQNRVADYIENEKNAQAAQDAYRQHVTAQLQDPNLTDAAKKQIFDNANAVMAAHSQYETQHLDKDTGVGGLFRKILVHATGGPMKVREPINFKLESGNIHHLTLQPESQKSFWVNEANKRMAAIDTKYMNAEEVEGQAHKIANDMQLSRHLGEGWRQWVQDARIGFPGGDTFQGDMLRLAQQRAARAAAGGAQPTAPPPKPLPFTGIAAGSGAPPQQMMPLPPAIAGALNAPRAPFSPTSTYAPPGPAAYVPFDPTAPFVPTPTASAPAAAPIPAGARAGGFAVMKDGTKRAITKVNPDGTFEVEDQ